MRDRDRNKDDSMFRDIDKLSQDQDPDKYVPPWVPVENPQFSWREAFAFVWSTFKIVMPLALLFILPLVLIMILLFWLFPESRELVSISKVLTL